MRRVARGLLIAFFVISMALPAVAAKKRPGLAGSMPEDVFLFVNARSNPEKEFLEKYWTEVWEAAVASGIKDDLWDIVAGLGLDEEGLAELERLKALATELIAGVDCDTLAQEMAFGERFMAPESLQEIGPPNLVWLLRGDKESAGKNFAGLLAILDALVAEINKAAEGANLVVVKNESKGAKVATVDLLKHVPGAPTAKLFLALHRDLVIIALGQPIFDEVLGLVTGSSKTGSLAANQRFKQAFAKLPAAEDTQVFFAMPNLLKPIRAIADLAMAKAAEEAMPEDLVINSVKSGEAHELAMKAWEVYEQQDYAQGLELIVKAHEIAPQDSRVLYYLACFHALSGNTEEALGFLEQAVDGGFYSPHHISNDPDLQSIRDDERYQIALDKAKNEAASKGKNHIEIAKRIVDRLFGMPAILDYFAVVEYTEGYSVHTQAQAALVSGARSNPFYPVFGKRPALKTFDRYLPAETMSFSVNSGIDLGALYEFIIDSIRMVGSDGEEALAAWEKVQKENEFSFQTDVIGWIDGEFAIVTLEQDQGSVLLLKVSDEALAREKTSFAVDLLTTQLTEAAQTNPMLGMLAVRKAPTEHEKLEGFENLFVGMSPEPLVWGVADGQLIFATKADAVVKCLETAAAKHPGIRTNKRVMSEALDPKGSFAAVSLSDQRALGKNIAEVLQALTMVGGMATMAIEDPAAKGAVSKLVGIIPKLVPVVSKIDFFKSKASVATFDGLIWQTHGVTHYFSDAELVKLRAVSVEAPEPAEAGGDT